MGVLGLGFKGLGFRVELVKNLAVFWAPNLPIKQAPALTGLKPKIRKSQALKLKPSSFSILIVLLCD